MLAEAAGNLASPTYELSERRSCSYVVFGSHGASTHREIAIQGKRQQTLNWLVRRALNRVVAGGEHAADVTVVHSSRYG